MHHIDYTILHQTLQVKQSLQNFNLCTLHGFKAGQESELLHDLLNLEALFTLALHLVTPATDGDRPFFQRCLVHRDHIRCIRATTAVWLSILVSPFAHFLFA